MQPFDIQKLCIATYTFLCIGCLSHKPIQAQIPEPISIETDLVLTQWSYLTGSLDLLFYSFLDSHPELIDISEDSSLNFLGSIDIEKDNSGNFLSADIFGDISGLFFGSALEYSFEGMNVFVLADDTTEFSSKGKLNDNNKVEDDGKIIKKEDGEKIEIEITATVDPKSTIPRTYKFEAKDVKVTENDDGTVTYEGGAQRSFKQGDEFKPAPKGDESSFRVTYDGKTGTIEIESNVGKNKGKFKGDCTEPELINTNSLIVDTITNHCDVEGSITQIPEPNSTLGLLFIGTLWGRSLLQGKKHHNLCKFRK